MSGWPAEMRATVAVALTSRFPIVLWLGAEELFLVYNDTYIPMLGDKHPAALGQPGRRVWWDVWDPIGPMLAGVVATGRATWSDDLRLALVTAGQRQERYFTFSYGPVVAAAGDRRVLRRDRDDRSGSRGATTPDTEHRSGGADGNARRRGRGGRDGTGMQRRSSRTYHSSPCTSGATSTRSPARGDGRVAGLLPASLADLLGSKSVTHIHVCH